jgi:hypothetical protein
MLDVSKRAASRKSDTNPPAPVSPISETTNSDTPPRLDGRRAEALRLVREYLRTREIQLRLAVEFDDPEGTHHASVDLYRACERRFLDAYYAYRNVRRALIDLVLGFYGKPSGTPSADTDPWVLPALVGGHVVVASTQTHNDSDGEGLELVVFALSDAIDLEMKGCSR